MEHADWGNLRRSRPFSEGYGFDRGRPIDRPYIERFLGQHTGLIRGDVLEVADDIYTCKFGALGATAHVLDIDPANLRATIIADLAERNSLPPGMFDCFICTQTLQYVSDVGIALENAWRAIAPGGTLLVSVPTTSRVDPGSPDTDRWRFTPVGLSLLVQKHCAGPRVVAVQGFGSLVSVLAFTLGLAEAELTAKEMQETDPAFPLIACARVTKVV